MPSSGLDPIVILKSQLLPDKTKKGKAKAKNQAGSKKSSAIKTLSS